MRQYVGWGSIPNMNRVLIRRGERRHTERDGHVAMEAETRSDAVASQGIRSGDDHHQKLGRGKTGVSSMGFRGAWTC